MSSSNEKTIRFYLVENVSSAIARGLRQQNINVTTTDENGLIGVTDEQLEFAISQNRAIFTHDADFLRLHKKGLQHKGIVYCSQKKQNLSRLVKLLLLSNVFTFRPHQN